VGPGPAHGQQRRHAGAREAIAYQGHGDVPTYQSTMKSLAPVVVEERCASA
jgi:hypothetical protein